MGGACGTYGVRTQMETDFGGATRKKENARKT
jgi:hypothetical protein